MTGSTPTPDHGEVARMDYGWFAREVFRAAQAEQAELRVLARRTPVWEELAARFAGVTAMFAEAAAAAALAGLPQEPLAG
jgi:hypothetical protein